jgi:hypothetical protein
MDEGKIIVGYIDLCFNGSQHQVLWETSEISARIAVCYWTPILEVRHISWKCKVIRVTDIIQNSNMLQLPPHNYHSSAFHVWVSYVAKLQTTECFHNTFSRLPSYRMSDQGLFPLIISNANESDNSALLCSKNKKEVFLSKHAAKHGGDGTNKLCAPGKV